MSYKCGYSTFRELEARGVVGCIESNIDNLKLYSKIYIIVRNPIARVISFYKDKFILYRHQLVQPSQIAMLQYASAKKIQSGDFSFSDLVNAIQDGYSNEHIYNFSNIKPAFDVLKKPFTVLKLDSSYTMTRDIPEYFQVTVTDGFGRRLTSSQLENISEIQLHLEWR